MFGRLFVGCMIALNVACGQQSDGIPSGNFAEIEVVVTTTSGVIIPQSLVIFRDESGNEFRKTGQSIQLSAVPYGIYNIEIQSSGFSTRREQVGVYQPTLSLHLGLDVSAIHGEQSLGIAGAVSSHTSSGGVWVRVVSIYSGELIEDRVSPSGEFHLAGLHQGKYVLLVFAGDRLLLSKPFELKNKTLTLNLELTPPSGQ